MSVKRDSPTNKIPATIEDDGDVENPQEKDRLLGALDPAPTGTVKVAFEDDTHTMKAIQLVWCFLGLQASYITWGLVQEKVMTQPYGTGTDVEYFNSSAFLVFSNRFLGLFISLILVYWPTGDSRRKTLKAPLLEYAPSSLSNILSSWAQYEALKYVSFPTQVLSKSGKIIPVMLVGKLMHKKSYPWTEYGEAALITLGVTLFSLNEKKPKHGAGSDSAFGVMLLFMYLTCDSFTSQWQDKVFKKYQVNQFQMMLGVNICSLLFTGASLLQSGQGLGSWYFMMRHPDAGYHIVLLSISSAVGQLFIFYTIKKFGPVVFTIIMTIRQMLSMVISCILFGHPIAWTSALGAAVCFGSIGYRIRRNLLRGRRGGGAAGGSS